MIWNTYIQSSSTITVQLQYDTTFDFAYYILLSGPSATTERALSLLLVGSIFVVTGIDQFYVNGRLFDHSMFFAPFLLLDENLELFVRPVSCFGYLVLGISLLLN